MKRVSSLTSHRLLLAASLVFFSLVSGPVRAQDAEYERLTKAAVDEYQLGHWEEAGALFARAHELQPSARTFWGMGIVAFEDRRYVDAITYLQQALGDARKPLTEKQRTQSDSLIKRASDLVVRLPVQVEPAHATVLVDGRPLVRDERGLALFDVGTRELIGKAPGYEEAVRTVHLSAGSVAPIRLKLHASSASASSEEPQSDGEAMKRSVPAHGAPVDGSPAGPMRPLKWTALGLSVASLAVAGVAYGLRQAAAKRWNDDAQCPEPKAEVCSSERDAVARWQLTSVITGSLGAAFAAAAVTLFVLDRPAETARSAAQACALDPLRVAVHCRMSF